MLKRVFGLLITVILSLNLAACAPGQADNIGLKSIIGGLGGAALGGWGGSQIGHGGTQLAATAVGTLLGGAIGYGIGQSLDNIDRQTATNTAQQAVVYGQPGQRYSWQSQHTGNQGYVDILNRGRDNYSGANCTQYRQTIFVQGRSQTATGIACQRPDGTWAIQSEGNNMAMSGY